MATTIHALAYKVSMDTSRFKDGAVAVQKELNHGKRITDSYKTSIQRAEDEIEKITDLHRKGAISTQVYRKEIDRLSREFKESERAASKFSKVTKTLTSMKFAVGSALAFIGAERLTSAIRNDISEMDKLIKQSRRLGIETAELVKVMYAASLSTTMNQEQVGKSLQEMQKRIGETKQGTGEAIKAFDLLGISIDEIAGQSAIDNLIRISDAFADIQNEQDRLFAADKIFGEAGIEMLTMLQMGGDDIRKLTKEAETLGLTWDEKVNGSIEGANDAFTRMSAAVSGLFREVSTSLSPAIARIAQDITNVIQVYRGLDMRGTVQSELATGGIRGMRAAAFMTGNAGFMPPAAATREQSAVQQEQLQELRRMRVAQENDNLRYGGRLPALD